MDDSNTGPPNPDPPSSPPTVVSPSARQLILPNRRRRHRTDSPRHIVLYSPSAVHFYRQIAKLEVDILPDNTETSALYTSWTISSRAYYAILFYIYILHVRIEADIATEGERDAYKSINQAHCIRNLPIDGSLVNALRLAVPYRRATSDQPGIYPEKSRFITVHEGSRLEGSLQLGDIMVPLSYVHQPSPRILAHLQRWIHSRYKHDPDPPISNRGDVIRTLVYGSLPESDLIDQFTRLDMLNVLFNNPALEHPLASTPDQASVHIGGHSDLQDPPRVDVFSHTYSESHYILTELLSPHTSEWFTFAKMTASSQACISGDPEIFAQVLAPLTTHQTEDGIEQIQIPPPDMVESPVDFSQQWTKFINI